MIRGDTESIVITCETLEKAPRPFVKGERLTLTIKTSTDTEWVILRKVAEHFEDGAAIIPISHEDTKNLKCKVYVYDLQLIDEAGSFITIIPPSKFELLPEVTYE